jgi:hypothetical protein
VLVVVSEIGISWVQQTANMRNDYKLGRDGYYKSAQ